MNDAPSPAKSVNPIMNLLHSERFDPWGVLHRRWKYLAGGVALGLGLAIAYYCVASTKYESMAQILIMKKDSTLPARGVEKQTDNASQVSEDLLATHMQIVQSPQIVRTALKRSHLEGLQSIQRRLATDQNEVEYIIDHLKVTRGGTGQARLANVLNVAFRHISDEDCEQVLNAVVESYQAFLADKFQDVSKEAVKLIAEAKDELGADLESAESEYQRFREEAPLLWNGDVSSNTHRLNYERLQASLSDMQVSFASAKTRLEIVQQRMGRQGEVNDLDLLALLDDSHIAAPGIARDRQARRRRHRGVSDHGSRSYREFPRRVRRAAGIDDEGKDAPVGLRPGSPARAGRSQPNGNDQVVPRQEARQPRQPAANAIGRAQPDAGLCDAAEERPRYADAASNRTGAIGRQGRRGGQGSGQFRARWRKPAQAGERTNRNCTTQSWIGYAKSTW